MPNYQDVSVLFYLVGFAAGIIVLFFTWRIYSFKLLHARLEADIAKQRLESLKNESENTMTVLKMTNQITGDIAHSISQRLVDNPTWLDRFMDQTGVTYSASVYGKRIGHFYYEKARIAKD